MSILNKVKNDEQLKTEDSLGFVASLPSKVYSAKIKLAYLTQAQSGANAVALHYEIDGNEHNETIYFTNKKGETYYVKGSNKRLLPGYSLLEEMSQILTDEHLLSSNTEERFIELYDYKSQSKKPTEVEVLVDWLDQDIALGLIEKKEYKNKLINGTYQPIDDVRQYNSISKVFTLEGLSINEKFQGITEPKFLLDWQKKYEGKLIDLTDGVEPLPVSDVPKDDKPKKSLFNNKTPETSDTLEEDDNAPFDSDSDKPKTKRLF